MNAELIIWKDAVNNNSMQELGKACEVFKGCKTLFVTKNTDKRAVVMFKNDKEQVCTVVTTATVNKLFRAGKLTKAQLVTLPILRSRVKDATEDTLWLSLPAQGWQDMVTPEEITNFEELATL